MHRLAQRVLLERMVAAGLFVAWSGEELEYTPADQIRSRPKTRPILAFWKGFIPGYVREI